jgi:hypothetical protein
VTQARRSPRRVSNYDRITAKVSALPAPPTTSTAPGGRATVVETALTTGPVGGVADRNVAALMPAFDKLRDRPHTGRLSTPARPPAIVGRRTDSPTRRRQTDRPSVTLTTRPNVPPTAALNQPTRAFRHTVITRQLQVAYRLPLEHSAFHGLGLRLGGTGTPPMRRGVAKKTRTCFGDGVDARLQGVLRSADLAGCVAGERRQVVALTAGRSGRTTDGQRGRHLRASGR